MLHDLPTCGASHNGVRADVIERGIDRSLERLRWTFRTSESRCGRNDSSGRVRKPEHGHQVRLRAQRKPITHSRGFRLAPESGPPLNRGKEAPENLSRVGPAGNLDRPPARRAEGARLYCGDSTTATARTPRGVLIAVADGPARIGQGRHLMGRSVTSVLIIA
jgi:hypothetical protein